MSPGAKILQQVRRGVQTVTYGNPLYQKILSSGDEAPVLRFTPPDLWPGDAQAGTALLAEQCSLFGDGGALRNMAQALRNLRAVGTDAARQRCLNLIDNWLQHYDRWDEAEWSPGILGARLASWIGFYEFYAPAAAPEFEHAISESLLRQWRHLVRTISPQNGLGGLEAARGLIYGGFNFPEGDKALGLGLDLLRRQLAAEILPDGGHRTRNPSMLFHMLKHVAELRAILQAVQIEVPAEIQAAIEAMAPALRFFRHGDGGLALFQGSCEETPLLIDAVLTQAEKRGRALRRLQDSGYERITAGRSLLVADCGRPPLRGHDVQGHAGLLSFEFGQGRERIIVNCGDANTGDINWRMACAATAAHSTLTVEDTNACELLASGGIGQANLRVEVQRYEQDGEHYIEMRHNGYQHKFDIVHQRSLCLSADGDVLRGQDILSGTPGRGFTLRWHLHPQIQASLAHGGNAALLRTPSGTGWRLRVESGEIGLEPSIYCGGNAPRRCLQLRVNGRTQGAETAIAWSLAREKKE